MEPSAPAPTPPPVSPGGLPDPNAVLPAAPRHAKRRIILIVLLIFILIAVGVGVFVVSKKGTKKPAASGAGSTELENVSGDELKQFKQALLTPTTKEVVTFNPNAHFNNDVTVDKLLTAGAISTENLNITGAVSIDSANIANGIFTGGGATIQGDIDARNNLTVHGSLAAGSASFGGNVAVAGTLTAATLAINDFVGNNITSGATLTVNGHVVTGGTTPGVAIGGNMAGGTINIDGGDTSGTVTFHTGTNPVAGIMATVTFRKRFNSTPRVVITPVNGASGALQFFVSRNTGFFTIDTANNPIGDTDYAFDYWVVE